MPAHYAKIPGKVRKKGAIVIDRYAIFCSGLLTAGRILNRINNLEQQAANKGGSIPMHGHLTVAGKKYYYCLYGLIDKESIYIKNNV